MHFFLFAFRLAFCNGRTAPEGARRADGRPNGAGVERAVRSRFALAKFDSDNTTDTVRLQQAMLAEKNAHTLRAARPVPNPAIPLGLDRANREMRGARVHVAGVCDGIVTEIQHDCIWVTFDPTHKPSRVDFGHVSVYAEQRGLDFAETAAVDSRCFAQELAVLRREQPLGRQRMQPERFAPIKMYAIELEQHVRDDMVVATFVGAVQLADAAERMRRFTNSDYVLQSGTPQEYVGMFLEGLCRLDRETQSTRGVGRQLLQCAIDLATSRGERLFLSVFGMRESVEADVAEVECAKKSHNALLKYYRQCNFVPICRYVRQPGNSVYTIMQLVQSVNPSES